MKHLKIGFLCVSILKATHISVREMSAPISIYLYHQFKLHRTQLIIYSIDKLLVEQNGIPLPIFMQCYHNFIQLYSTLWTTDFATDNNTLLRTNNK